MTLSSSQMRRAYGTYRCNQKDYREMLFLSRYPVKIIGEWLEAWQAAEQALINTGYGPATVVSSYNCRKIAGTRQWSLHAYRLAIDIDPQQNWRYDAPVDWSRSKLTEEQVMAVESIHFNDGAQAFFAGARFLRPDPMHFQAAASLASVRSGVDWSTVEGHQEAMMPKEQWDRMIKALFEGRPDKFNPPGGYVYWQNLDPNSSEWNDYFWPAFVEAISLT